MDAASRRIDLIGASAIAAITLWLTAMLSTAQANNLRFMDFNWPPVCTLAYHGWVLGVAVVLTILLQFQRAVASESPVRARLLVNLGWLYAVGWSVFTGVAWTMPWAIIGTKLD
jgi:hypothetical protein